MKRLIAIGLMSFALTGCAGLASILTANATVVSIVDGVRAACGWELNSSDVQALMNSGILGLSTTQSYIGAACAAFANLPVAAAPGGQVSARIGSVAVRAQRVVK